MIDVQKKINLTWVHSADSTVEWAFNDYCLWLE